MGRKAPFALVFLDGQEIVFQPSLHPVDATELSDALKALRKLGPLTSPHMAIDLQTYGMSVAATSALYEPPIAA